MLGYERFHNFFKHSGIIKKRLAQFRAARVTPLTDSFNIVEDNIDHHFHQLQSSWNKGP